MTQSRNGSIEVAVVEGISKIARDEWNAVVGDNDSPFVDWDWLNAMEQSKSAIRATGWAPYHMVIRDGENKIAGACPLYLKTHSMGEFVFDHGWAEAAERAGIKYYPKLLIGVPFTPHTGRRFLTAADADRNQMISALGRAIMNLCAENKLSSAHVTFCEADEAATLAKLGFLERLGYQYHWHNAGFATFDDYLARLKHKRRTAVRHERGALEQQGLTVKVLAGDEIPDSLFAPMYRIYVSTLEKLYWGRQYLTPEFFDLMRTDFKRHVCFELAYKGSELVAGSFCLEKAGVLYGRYWGCFEDFKFLHFNVCYYAGIAHCIERGLTRFEPGAGGEYKWLRGFDPALTRSMHFLAHPGFAKAVGDFLKRERREVASWIEEGRERSQLKPPPPSDAEVE
jgi:predicted N-acyltransferase